MRLVDQKPILDNEMLAKRITQYGEITADLQSVVQRIHNSKPLYLRCLNRVGLAQRVEDVSLQKRLANVKGEHQKFTTSYELFCEGPIPSVTKDVYQNEARVAENCNRQTKYRLLPLLPPIVRKRIIEGARSDIAIENFQADLQLFDETLLLNRSNGATILAADKRALDSMKRSLDSALIWRRELNAVELVIFLLSLTQKQIKESSELSDELKKEVIRQQANSSTEAGIELYKARIVQQIRGKIEELPVGESMIIPGGARGHAVVYKVLRTSADAYSFELINTGFGSITHRRLNKTAEDGVTLPEDRRLLKSREALLIEQALGIRLPLRRKGEVISLKWVECKLSDITDSSFLNDLITMTTRSLYIPSDFFQPLVVIASRYIGRITCSKVCCGQDGPSCSYSSILAYAESMLSRPIYESLHLLIMRKAATRVNDLFPGENLSSHIREELGKKRAQLSHSIRKWHSVDEKEKTALRALFNGIMRRRLTSQRPAAHAAPPISAAEVSPEN